MKIKGTKLYQQLPADMLAHWKACAPLREIEENRPVQPAGYTYKKF